jgi:hypothetical protein
VPNNYELELELIFMTITRGIGINKKTLKNIPERVLQDKPNFPEPLFNINIFHADRQQMIVIARCCFL